MYATPLHYLRYKLSELRFKKCPTFLLAILIHRHQPLFANLREIGTHLGRVPIRSDNMDWHPFPDSGYRLALKHVAVQRTGFIGYGYNFIVSPLSHFYSWTGAGIGSV